MSNQARVVMCAVGGEFLDDAVRAISRQGVRVDWFTQDPGDAYAYGRDLRKLWREPGDLIVVEGDTVVPPGSIKALQECGEPWCTHPHWVGWQYQINTLGLARFSAGLRANFPALADRALGRRDGRMMIWMGVTRHPPGSAYRVSNRVASTAALRPGVDDPWDERYPAAWPTTVEALECDTYLTRALDILGIKPHVHAPPTLHLRPYSDIPDARGRTGRPDPGMGTVPGR